MALLDVRELKTYFFTSQGTVKAVDGVSLQVEEGETLGLIGESGCGKTQTGFSLLRLIPKREGKIVSGQIYFNGEDLLLKSEKEMGNYRGRHLSMILQDPMVSLNPVFSIGDQVGEGITLHQGIKQKKKLREKIIEIMRLVRIPSPGTRLRDYPHQYSGGMRQRIVGAIALACHPRLLIADEATTSLDATIQVQYLNVLKDIQREHNLSMIFITHDFGIVAKMCNKVAVMYAGKIVEMGELKTIFNHPAHPYTKALLHSVPKVEERIERLYSIEGQPPRPINLPPGCSFRPRCSKKFAICEGEEFPPEADLGHNHVVRCWKYV